MAGVDEDILVQAPSGIFSFTEDGTIQRVNHYCCQLLEYEQAELEGKNISCLLTVSGRIFYQTHFYPLVKLHKHVEEIFLNLVSKSKRDVPVVLNAIIVESTNGFEVVCSFIQVLNRRKYEDEILQAKRNAEDALRKNEALERIKLELEVHQKELDRQVTLLNSQNHELLQLGNVITHDLQEPVRKLIMFSSELLDGNIPKGKETHALSVIKKSSQKIKTLLINLQEYLGMTALSSKRSQVNLDELVRNELRQLQNKYPNTNVEAEISPLPTISGNAEQLHFMFHHLLKNAFDHGTTENRLELTVKAVIVKENLFHSINHKYSYVDFVRITVSDKGPGFENSYRKYIFDVLKKLNTSLDNAGFGLAFCKKIVEYHFGTIDADSDFGAGTTFTVMLPVD